MLVIKFQSEICPKNNAAASALLTAAPINQVVAIMGVPEIPSLDFQLLHIGNRLNPF
jgi:hypothetical protein